MRVADKMAFDQVNRAITRNRSDLDLYQNQAATQKRITKPSDDPVAASQVLGARTEEQSNKQFVKNLNYAKSFLDYSEQSLGDLDNVLVRAKELAISQANDASANPETRRAVAAEVSQLYAEAIQIANRRLGDRFIFGGFKTVHPPFDQNGNYNGDDGEMKVHIDKDTFLSMNMPGSVALLGKGLSSDGLNFRSLAQARTLEQLKTQETKHPADFGQTQDSGGSSGSLERAPASLRISDNVAPNESGDETTPRGVNVFGALKKFQIALMANDRDGVQESMDNLDGALQQVIVARSALGSRVTAINNTLNSMQSQLVDDKSTISQLEDADVFHVISQINKAQSALQATLQTSGRLMQKSLMDFVQA